jgi:hypothetical protein
MDRPSHPTHDYEIDPKMGRLWDVGQDRLGAFRGEGVLWAGWRALPLWSDERHMGQNQKLTHADQSSH